MDIRKNDYAFILDIYYMNGEPVYLIDRDYTNHRDFVTDAQFDLELWDFLNEISMGSAIEMTNGEIFTASDLFDFM